MGIFKITTYFWGLRFWFFDLAPAQHGGRPGDDRKHRGHLQRKGLHRRRGQARDDRNLSRKKIH